MLTLKKSVLRVLGLKKSSKVDLFKYVKTKIFIFEYFVKSGDLANLVL